MYSTERAYSSPKRRQSQTLRVAVLLLAAGFLAAACDPFVARVKGGSESKPNWEVGVKF